MTHNAKLMIEALRMQRSIYLTAVERFAKACKGEM